MLHIIKCILNTFCLIEIRVIFKITSLICSYKTSVTNSGARLTLFFKFLYLPIDKTIDCVKVTIFF